MEFYTLFYLWNQTKSETSGQEVINEKCEFRCNFMKENWHGWITCQSNKCSRGGLKVITDQARQTTTYLDKLPRKNIFWIPIAWFNHHKFWVEFHTKDDLAPYRLQFFLEQRFGCREVRLLGKHFHESILSLPCIKAITHIFFIRKCRFGFRLGVS